MTIRKSVFLMLLICLMNSTISYSASKSYPCVVRFENGDTRELILLNDNLSNSMGKDRKVLEFTEYMSKEKIKIETKDIYSLTFTAGEKPVTYRYVYAYSYKNMSTKIAKKPSKNKMALLVNHVDDNVTVLYEGVVVRMNGVPTYHDYYYFLPKGNKEARLVFHNIDGSNVLGWAAYYRKQLAKYYKNCPSMVQRIKNKEFDLVNGKDFDVLLLVDIYNEYLDECKQ